MAYFLLGFLGSVMFLEPIVINFIYLSNIDLFNDILLTKKNQKKLIYYYSKKGEKENGKSSI